MENLKIHTRRKFILRNNRKVKGEWLVYQPEALPSPIPFVSNEELDKLINVMLKTATVQVDELNCKILCGRLPEGVTGYDVARAIAELDG